jgi:hypothetical protein
MTTSDPTSLSDAVAKVTALLTEYNNLGSANAIYLELSTLNLPAIRRDSQRCAFALAFAQAFPEVGFSFSPWDVMVSLPDSSDARYIVLAKDFPHVSAFIRAFDKGEYGF